jgi:hypothetical protein
MSSAKFDALAAKVGSTDLAGYITTHDPKVAARAAATRARHKAAKMLRRSGGGESKSH